MSNQKPVDSKFYTKRQKVIRDLIHEYIHLTAFENSLVDTICFQRLRDIKQVTASVVFPNANHTRFEHSLGTFELTRRAIEAVKDNGLFLVNNKNGVKEIHPNLEFSTLIAALLHDVGHSPFSHLGEKQFDEGALSNRLERELKKLLDGKVAQMLSNKGARHEKLSCLVIVEKLWGKLKDNRFHKDNDEVYLDLEHVCRCILGVPYECLNELPKYVQLYDENLLISNFCVRLVNCSTFDMDSLDYIMRDTLYFALNSSRIDTNRLFSNMFISEDGFPIFKRQALSVLEDIIDEKNSDYLNAINHHAVLYSNFLFEFLFRRFKNDHLYDMDGLFSANAIINLHVSDSDVWSMFKEKDREFKYKIDSCNYSSEDEEKHVNRAHELLTSIFSRNFLKPFWKDIVEFEDFKIRHFANKDATFKRICNYVCSNNSSAESFRSEVVPAIVDSANRVYNIASSKMPQKLEGHQLFLIEVQQKWLEKANVDGLSIYIRKNEVRNPTRFGGETPYGYIEKSLSDVLPLSHYSDIYSKKGFYIYVKPISTTNPDVERIYYDNLERIIVIALSYFADDNTGRIDKLISPMQKGPEKDALLNEIYDELWGMVKTELQIDRS